MSRKVPKTGTELRSEYDFTGAVRGKFFRKDAKHMPPVHLQPDVRHFLQKRADARGIELSDLVNELLKKHIEMFETVDT